MLSLEFSDRGVIYPGESLVPGGVMLPLEFSDRGVIYPGESLISLTTVLVAR